MEVVGSLELPADSWWDEITLQALACTRCAFRGLAVYEESRRGALDSEAVNHRGHRVKGDAVTALLAGIAACPAPRDSSCRCAAHAKWGRADTFGQWLGVPDSIADFPLVPAAHR
jgi:hypothetical protein